MTSKRTEDRALPAGQVTLVDHWFGQIPDIEPAGKLLVLNEWYSPSIHINGAAV